MPDKKTLRMIFRETHFWKFVAWCFGPVVVPLVNLAAMLWIGLALNLMISFSVPKGSDLSFSKLWSVSRISEAFLMALLPVFLFYLLTVCYRLYLRASAWLMKGLIVYGFWIIEIFSVGYFVLLAIGGTSMASAEGVASRGALYGGAVFYSILPIVWSQLFVIPWVCFSIWIMKRGEKKETDV